MRRTRCARAGFTLIELLAVLLVVGLVTAVAVPNLAALLAREPLEEAAAEAVAALREARLEAARSGRSLGVSVSTDGRRLSARGLRTELGAGIRAEAASGNRTITFHPNGMSGGGPWRLRDASGESLIVETEPLTGAVRLRREPASETR